MCYNRLTMMNRTGHTGSFTAPLDEGLTAACHITQSSEQPKPWQAVKYNQRIA